MFVGVVLKTKTFQICFGSRSERDGGRGADREKLFFKFYFFRNKLHGLKNIIFFIHRISKILKIFFVGSTSVKPIIKNNLKFFNSVAIELQIFSDRPRGRRKIFCKTSSMLKIFLPTRNFKN
jgi:hypothetical protein